MFKHIFATMHDALDGIINEFPDAGEQRKQQLQYQLSALRAMSDSFMEEWLLFEEKMDKLENLVKPLSGIVANPAIDFPVLDSVGTGEKSEPFLKGQGYYQLFMFEKAAEQFMQVIDSYPDFLLARLYLAMSYLRLGNTGEAYKHFKLLISLTEHRQMKAIAYNAMGCIQLYNKNVNKAYEYFKLAYQTDPSLVHPLVVADSQPFFHFDQGTIH